MSTQRASGTEADRPTGPERDASEPTSTRWTTSTPGHVRDPLSAPRSRQEADARYVAARDVWSVAMHRASSGRSADLASLAIAQQAYEEATAERDRWQTGAPVAIKIEPEDERTPIDIIVGQELAWRRVHESGKQAPSLLGRLARRITRRG